jgi:hypothetical protein
MPDMEAPVEDSLEQERDLVPGIEDLLQGPPPDLEVPEADAAEQLALIREGRPAGGVMAPGATAEFNEADAAEQAVEVGFDEDDYR